MTRDPEPFTVTGDNLDDLTKQYCQVDWTGPDGVRQTTKHEHPLPRGSIPAGSAVHRIWLLVEATLNPDMTVESGSTDG